MKISKYILYASAIGILALFLIPMASGISHIKDMMHYLDITYRQKQELNDRTKKIDAYEQVFANLRRYVSTPQSTYLPENIGGFSTPFKLEPSMIDNNTIVLDSINQGLIDKSILEIQELIREHATVFKATPVGWPIDTNNSYQHQLTIRLPGSSVPAGPLNFMKALTLSPPTGSRYSPRRMGSFPLPGFGPVTATASLSGTGSIMRRCTPISIRSGCKSGSQCQPWLDNWFAR